MNRFKNIFKALKNEGINSMFQEFNRKLVLGISTGDNTPKSPDTLAEIEAEIQKHRNELKHGDGDIDREMNFLRPLIESCESYRHCFIDIASYGTAIDYFVLRGALDPKTTAPAKTMIVTVPDCDSFGEEDVRQVVHAVMVIFEDNDCITDDTFGKIVKHELTHVLLQVLEDVLGVDMGHLPDVEQDDELYAFQEFLCDYIQCDSTVGLTEHPVEKFRETMKKHLTWVANDTYEPYLKMLEEYYAEEVNKEAEE